MAIRLPAPVIARTYLFRGLRLWIGVRVLVSLIFFLAGGLNGVLESFGGLAPWAIVALCLFLGVVDLWRRNERALLGNLGVSRAMVGAALLLTAVSGELSLRLLVGAP